MIKPVQQRQPQHPSTPVSSAQGKGKTEAVDSTANMHSTVENIKKLSKHLGAGRHSITGSSHNENLAALTKKIADKCL
ncbi:MAG: hypothetical protein KF898_05325 [Parachlamydiales bacterium]|nr:hypothetical protein [Candidatus Acheromyda pituitae]